MRSPALKDVVRLAGAFGSIGWLENTMTPPAFAAAGPATLPCGVSAASVASAGAGLGAFGFSGRFLAPDRFVRRLPGGSPGLVGGLAGVILDAVQPELRLRGACGAQAQEAQSRTHGPRQSCAAAGQPAVKNVSVGAWAGDHKACVVDGTSL